MNLSDYLSPFDEKIVKINGVEDKSKLLYNICIYNPDKKYNLKNFDLAIIGINVENNSNQKNQRVNPSVDYTSPDLIRNQLYQLYCPNNKIKIIDLGNVKTGKTIKDTYIALRDIVIELLNNNVVAIIIGGSSEITFANYLAYEKLEQTINICSINSKINLKPSGADKDSFINKIILQKKNHLFNYSNIAYQSYYVSQDEIDLANKLFFDYYRLGFIQEDIKKAEPILRDADIVSFSLSSIKQSDSPGYSYPNPNGLYGEEACQIARYAGMSDKVTSFGLYDFNPDFDKHDQTAHLSAQIIWYFIDGFYNRKNEYPHTDINNYQKYIVYMDEIKHDLTFYKSNKTERWWIEVPSIKNITQNKIIVSCSIEDYQAACNQDIPDRWWKIYQKIS